MLNDEFLSQDIDIMPDANDQEENDVTDIIPEEDVKEQPTQEEETQEEWEDTTTEESTLDPELEALFSDAFASQDETSDAIETASWKIEEVKSKVEEIQEDPENPNTENLLKEIYQDLLQTETSLQASEIARWVAESKVAELQAKVSELEINAAWQYQTDTPELMIINKLMTSAFDWNVDAKSKVKSAINRLYLSLFNNTIEEDNVKNNLEWVNETWISLNEKTLPGKSPEQEKEEYDPTDLMSMFG